MTPPLPDVQNYRSLHPFKLTRVGITGVRKPIRVVRDGRENTLVGTFDVYVDLPPEQRGTHMSRNVEAINEMIDAFARHPTPGLENLALEISKALLVKHQYASEAEVHIEADHFRERKTPDKKAPTLEQYELHAAARATREGLARKAIGATVIGMSACPCAMEGTRATFEARGHHIPAELPTPTHNQRNHAFLLVETDEAHALEAHDLIDLVEECLSAPTFEYLKRGDETALVLQAHAHPMFVEDVVREILSRVVKRYGHLPDDTLVSARSEAEESIHKHNAVAERVTTMGELKR